MFLDLQHVLHQKYDDVHGTEMDCIFLHPLSKEEIERTRGALAQAAKNGGCNAGWRRLCSTGPRCVR